MVSIINKTLSIKRAGGERFKVLVECDINFSELDICQMNTCGGGGSEGPQLFKLRCNLWGADSGLTGDDDQLHTFQELKYYPASGSGATEHAIFEEDIPADTLNEDVGGDEIYAEFILYNLYTLHKYIGLTDEVHLHA
jgi:hypothetical protein